MRERAQGAHRPKVGSAATGPQSDPLGRRPVTGPGGRTTAPPAPLLSPDGQLWWDGQRWQVVPQGPSSTPKRRSTTAQVGRGILVGLGLVAALTLAAVTIESNRSAQFKQQVDDAYCESFGSNDPECAP